MTLKGDQTTQHAPSWHIETSAVIAATADPLPRCIPLPRCMVIHVAPCACIYQSMCLCTTASMLHPIYNTYAIPNQNALAAANALRHLATRMPPSSTSPPFRLTAEAISK